MSQQRPPSRTPCVFFGFLHVFVGFFYINRDNIKYANYESGRFQELFLPEASCLPDRSSEGG